MLSVCVTQWNSFRFIVLFIHSRVWYFTSAGWWLFRYVIFFRFWPLVVVVQGCAVCGCCFLKEYSKLPLFYSVFFLKFFTHFTLEEYFIFFMVLLGVMVDFSLDTQLKCSITRKTLKPRISYYYAATLCSFSSFVRRALWCNNILGNGNDVWG